MGYETTLDDRPRLIRVLGAVLLTVLAVRFLRAGKRKTGLLAGIGALGCGVSAKSYSSGGETTIDIDTPDDGGTTSDSTTSEAISEHAETSDSASLKTRQSGSLTCASCGEPIRVGEGRGPNDDDEIVHDRCR